MAFKLKCEEENERKWEWIELEILQLSTLMSSTELIFHKNLIKLKVWIFFLIKFPDCHRYFHQYEGDKISHFDDVNDEIGSLEKFFSYFRMSFERDTMLVSGGRRGRRCRMRSHMRIFPFRYQRATNFFDMVAFYMMKNGY